MMVNNEIAVKLVQSASSVLNRQFKMAKVELAAMDWLNQTRVKNDSSVRYRLITMLAVNLVVAAGAVDGAAEAVVD